MQPVKNFTIKNQQPFKYPQGLKFNDFPYFSIGEYPRAVMCAESNLTI
jgi:hypothetical protein